MVTNEIDIPLDENEKKEKIEFLKKRKFEDFKIHDSFNWHSYPKHGIEIEKVKEIYYQFDKIVEVFKRTAKNGFKYTFIYKLKEYESMKLCFYLDDKPPKFFNVIPDYTNVEKKMKRKTGKWARKEYNKKINNN
ncbi:hypothetical protein J4429_05965 [Candidatus Pacearchaeota archaeon]|nr:hypothetical protein [Candidatus Pacearchaeota archaeon]